MTNDIDTVHAQVGLLKNCDGSAQFCNSYVSLMCGVIGPIKVSEAKESPEEACFEIIYKPLYNINTFSNDNSLDPFHKTKTISDNGGSHDQNVTIDEAASIGSIHKKDMTLTNLSKTFLRYKLYPTLNKCQEAYLSEVCRSAIFLDNYPNSQIVITIQELQQSSNSNIHHLLTGCINACCLALLDAGLSMKYLFCAISYNLGSFQLQFDAAHDYDCSLVFNQHNKSYISCYFKNEDENFLNTCQKLPIKQFELRKSLLFQLYKNMLMSKFKKVLS